MNKVIRYLFLTGIGLLIHSLAAEPLAINDCVTDSEAAAVKGAHIVLRTDFAGGWSKVSYDANATTDRGGIFTLKIGTGFYDLCVMADAFAPECRKIFIQDRSADQNFMLKVSTEVSKRIADKF